MDRRYLLRALPVLLVVALAGSPASAGVFWNRKTKPTPTEYVPELIRILKSDGDEHKRCSAAEELRQYDPQQFPDLIPALIEAVFSDKKPAVRAEAVQSLGKLRPVNPAAGGAIEQALAKDSSMRVRLQARSSLMQYRWAGYSAKGKDEAQTPTQTKEPPLAAEPPAPAAANPPRLNTVPAAPVSSPSSPRPMPVGTPVKRTQPAAAPSNGPELSPPPAPIPFSAAKTTKGSEEQGPELTPP
jgi:hypothetical protein